MKSNADSVDAKLVLNVLLANFFAGVAEGLNPYIISQSEKVWVDDAHQFRP